MTPYDDVFVGLRQAQVRYVVVGGLAVVLRGHARLTVDLDLVVDLATDRATAAIDVLVALGFQARLPVDPHAFAQPDVRQEWIDTKNLQVFSLYDPADALREVDLFASYPLPFEELLAHATEVAVGQSRIVVASTDDLIRMKQAAGRPQDVADVEALRRLVGRERT